MPLPERKGWNPYLAGALTGLVTIASVWIAGKYLGASTTFVRTAGMLEQTWDAERVKANPYFQKEKPIVDWQSLFVGGIFVGALAGAIVSRSLRLQATPDMWAERFGRNPVKRGLVAFLGGAVAMFGARLADG